MKTSLLFLLLAVLCFSQSSCTKEQQLTNPELKQSVKADKFAPIGKAVLENPIKAEGSFDYTITSFIPLSFDASGNPTTARISMEAEGKMHPFGKLSVKGSFTFDLVRGLGYDFNTTYADKQGNSFQSVGTSVLIGAPNGVPEYIINENLVNGTGRFERLSGSGETHVYQTQSTPVISGYYDVKWQLSLQAN